VASNSSSSGGIRLGGVLFVVFLVLKLCHVISWSWWWVTAPLWIPFGVVGLIICFCLIIALVTIKAER
jgi:hypothetical protein